MMFSDIEADSANMIVEIREFLDFVNSQTPSPPTALPRYINTAKGLIYVQLYGVIENTVLKAVAKTITYINSENLNVSKLKPCIHALVLNDKLNSLIDARSKKWNKRHDLFTEINLDGTANIDATLTPTDGKNIGLGQLKSIWNTFGLIEPIFNDMSFSGRLTDITLNRINVAHGNISAAHAGRSVTATDLYTRIADVSAFCTYFLSVFDDYVRAKKYLR